MAHDEFPPLTHQAKCVLINTLKGIDVSRPYWDRRFAAAVIRAVEQEICPNSPCKHKIRAIADNLHALPPVPPTREEMEEALQSLVGRIDFHPESQFAQEAAILASGIAHHCKVQP
jgi:hypothetical protein